MRRAFSEGDMQTLGNGNTSFTHSHFEQPVTIGSLTIEGRRQKLSRYRKKTGILAEKSRYYISQQLTEKSDVYSFGVILLELISDQEAISNENFGINCRNIVQWISSVISYGNMETFVFLFFIFLIFFPFNLEALFLFLFFCFGISCWNIVRG